MVDWGQNDVVLDQVDWGQDDRVLSAPPDPERETQRAGSILDLSEKHNVSLPRAARRQRMMDTLYSREAYEQAAQERREEKGEAGAAGYWMELIDATGRGAARVGSALKRAQAAITAARPGPGAWTYETPEITRARELRAKQYEREANVLWEVAQHPELAQRDDNLALKGINLIGETLPYITATTAAYTVAGPLGGFAVGGLVEGHSAYMEAVDDGVDPATAKKIGVAVGLVNGAIESVGGKFTEEFFQKVIKNKVKNKILRAGGLFTVGTLVEALEEGGQEISNIAGEEVYRDVDWNERLTRVGGAMAGGAFLGGTMRGMSVAGRQLMGRKEHAGLEDNLTKAIQERTGLPEENARKVAQDAIENQFHPERMGEEGKVKTMEEAFAGKELPEAPAEGVKAPVAGEVAPEMPAEEGVKQPTAKELWNERNLAWKQLQEAKARRIDEGDSPEIELAIDVAQNRFDAILARITPIIKEANRKGGARKPPWQMTKRQWELYALADQAWDERKIQNLRDAVERGEYGPDVDVEIVEQEGPINHRRLVQRAIQDGKPVPRHVLEEYKGEPWADEALAKLTPAPSEPQGKPTEAIEPTQIPLEIVMLFDELRANRIAWRKADTAGKAELMTRNRQLEHELIARGYDKPYVKAVETGKQPVPEPVKATAEEEAPLPPIGGPSGGVAWHTAVLQGLEKSKKKRRGVLVEQRAERKRRAGAYEGTLKSLMEQGVPAEEAIDKATAMWRGPLTEYQLYEPLKDLVTPEAIAAAYEDIATTDKLRPYERKKTKDAFKKLETGTVLTPYDVKMIKKWRPELFPIANERVPFTVRLFAQIEQILGLFKFPAAFDIQMRRQARWLRARHPGIYAKGVVENIGAYVSAKYADKLAEQLEENPNHADAQAHGVQFLQRHGESVEQRPEQYLSYLGERIPLFGKVYSASMRGFIDAFNSMQQALWDYKVDAWERQGVAITEEMLHDLAEFNNTFMGMQPAKTDFGRAARRVLSPVMWSPTLTWSRIRSPEMILTNPTMRKETAVTLASYIGSGIMMMMAASFLAKLLNRDDPVEWDLRSVDFGKIRIGDTRVDVYGDGGTYIRAYLQLLYGQKKNQAGRLRRRPRLEVIKQFVRNKRAPFFDLLGKIWSGRTFYGGPAWAIPDWAEMKEEGGIKQLVAKAGETITEPKSGQISYLVGKEIVTTFAPFFVQGLVEASWNDGWPVGLWAGTEEFLSGQTLSYEPSDYAKMQIVQDQVAVTQYDKLWEDLTPRQQDFLRRRVPEINELEEKAAADREPAEEISLREQNKTAQRITRQLPGDVRKELDAAGVRVSGLSRRLGDFWLNDRRYKAYERLAGEEIEMRLSKRIGASSWPRVHPNIKAKVLRDQINKSKEGARTKLKRLIDRGEL